jgi:signal transduction histidine kinase
MLYLQTADSIRHAPPHGVPVAELTAVSFERALLADDVDARTRELSTALARDPTVAEWVMSAARQDLGPAVHTMEDSVSWLAPRLQTKLAEALATATCDSDENANTRSDIELRLPALAKCLHAFEQRIADFEARLEREKLEALKELAYGASHEINNPLANIAARAQTLLEDETDSERRRKLSAIHRQAMRAHEMIADLMLFARPPKTNRSACDLRQIARQIVVELSERAEEQGTLLRCDPGNEPLMLHADATQLAVAIHAVVVNALEAAGEGGLVHIAMRRTEFEGLEWGEIAVHDDGPGVSDEVREHMFDPFFSGREAGRGLGFGLSKCWRIISEHGGHVQLRRPASGAEIVLLVPLAATLAATSVASTDPFPAP